MSGIIKNVIVFPSTYPTLAPLLPPSPDNLPSGISKEEYQDAKNLRTLYQLISMICPGSHAHYASFAEFDGEPPRNYSAKVSCTGDGTSWRVVMRPEGVRGIAWYFTGLKKLEGVFNTAVIRYWDAQQCETLLEAFESGGIASLPNNWRFVVRHDEVAAGSENLATKSATPTAGTQDENMTATEVCNGDNTTEAGQEKSVGDL